MGGRRDLVSDGHLAAAAPSDVSQGHYQGREQFTQCAPLRESDVVQWPNHHRRNPPVTDLTLVLPYFQNRGMLAEHYRVWRDYPSDLRARLHVVVVDDCSPIEFQ